MRDIINLGEIYEAAKIIKVKCGIKGNQSITQLVNAIKNIAPNGRTTQSGAVIEIDNKTLTYKSVQSSTKDIQDELQDLRNAIENNNSSATTSTIWPYGVVYLPEAAKKIKGGNSYAELQPLQEDEWNFLYNTIYNLIQIIHRLKIEEYPSASGDAEKWRVKRNLGPYFEDIIYTSNLTFEEMSNQVRDLLILLNSYDGINEQISPSISIGSYGFAALYLMYQISEYSNKLSEAVQLFLLDKYEIKDKNLIYFY